MTEFTPRPYSGFLRSRRGGQITRYLLSVLLVAAATGLSLLVTVEFSPTNLIMIYLLAVVLAAIYLGRGPAVLASLAGVLAFDYFFVPPRLTLNVADTEYLLSLAGLLIVGLVISYLATQARDQAQAAGRREAETAALYALTKDLATADDLDHILSAVSTHITHILRGNVAYFLPEGDHLRPYSDKPELFTSPDDQTAMHWVLQNNQSAGKGTLHFTEAWASYLPLRTSLRTIGVLGVQPEGTQVALGIDQLRLLEAFASQTALAIEHIQLAEQTRQIELLQATEKLQNALLNSISHDLRTPLVSITGALSTLEEQNASLEDETRKSLVETAREEADRLNRLVSNLLNITRLESGAIHIRREATDIQDLVGSALGELEMRLAGREVRVDVPADLPLVSVDFVLLVQALVNLLDNALKYSPEGSPLEVRAWSEKKEVCISILDRGIGIPPADLERVFDKFFRVQRPEQVTGTGLGLAISKGIVETHGGRIWAEQRSGGGTNFTIALPVEASA